MNAQLQAELVRRFPMLLPKPGKRLVASQMTRLLFCFDPKSGSYPAIVS